MGHVEDRWWKTVTDPETGKDKRVKTALYGRGLRYRVRYHDLEERERGKSFPDRAKKAAEDFLLKVESTKQSGDYRDPEAGRVTLRAYGDEWFRGMAFSGGTRNSVRSRLDSLIYPKLGEVQLGALLPRHIRDWLGWLTSKKIANSTRAVCFVHLSAILDAAVDDKRITSNPCRVKSVPRPQPDKRKIVPWTPEKVAAVEVELPERYRLTVALAAGCGLRQGEVFGLSDADIDRGANSLNIVRQVTVVDNRLVFAPPKGGKERSLPLAGSVLREIDAHAEKFQPVVVTLPWKEPDGPPETARLILSTETGGALYRSDFNRLHWRPALDRAGMGRTKRQDGMHALRHFFASVLLDGGESIKALAEWLGHADPAFTMRVYTHLLPSSNDRTRRAVDRAMRAVRGETGPDGLDTA
ncbi:Site-specific recombinase XerD [Actinosynnema pretiosum]|uniref:tyrosine-type recombinase/integrase n=1 Tax=Actinosynnema pretiosum TaxID=42197 RepID=UPI0020A52E01|nr:site-specific integrase [Actinosynnema pretiosum]MCP2097967.1 Site-specific recombinase XerD [Actinosynnema pretiosum]